jgi:hypothetical protein
VILTSNKRASILYKNEARRLSSYSYRRVSERKFSNKVVLKHLHSQHISPQLIFNSTTNTKSFKIWVIFAFGIDQLIRIICGFSTLFIKHNTNLSSIFLMSSLILIVLTQLSQFFFSQNLIKLFYQNLELFLELKILFMFK